jgi:hypothetical protein
MTQFLYGALTMAALTAGLFFLRFWRITRDRLFLFLAVAFWILSLNWAGLGLSEPDATTRVYYLLTRLLAFLVIIAGVVDKNRRGPNR